MALGMGNERAMDLSFYAWQKKYPFLYFDLTNRTGVNTNRPGGTVEITADIAFSAAPVALLTLYTVIYSKQSTIISLSDTKGQSSVVVNYPQ